MQKAAVIKATSVGELACYGLGGPEFNDPDLARVQMVL